MANNNTLHIRLFGKLTISTSTPDSEPVEVPPTRAGALLALLAIEISTNRAFTREEIVDLLWPEDDANVARNKLRQTLHDVRRLIAGQKLSPDAALIATRNSLQLNPACVSVDVAMFEAELEAVARELNPTIRAERLAAAVELYKGELLPGFYLERFITEKTRLEEAYHGALKSLALAYEETEQYDRGIECGRKLLSLNPLNEEAHFTLMRLYAATGQPSLVLRQYQNLERTLKEELGEEPSKPARQVMETLRDKATSRAASREVGSSPKPARAAVAEELATPDPISRAESESITDVSNTALDRRPRVESHALRRSKTRWVLAAFPPAVLCLMMLVLVLLKGHNTAAKTAVPHAQPPAPVVTHAAVLARYKLAADERGSEPTAMAADPAGNLYIAGFVETLHNDADFITIKYDSQGRELWRKRYNGTGNDVDRLRCIAVGAGGDVYVSGESDNGKGNGSTRLSGLDVVTIKYSPDGKELCQDRYNDIDNGDDRPAKMMLDSVGNAYVLCACHRLRNGKYTGCNIVLIKYSPDLKRLWVRRLDGGIHGDDVPTNMAMLNSYSGVCVCGYSRSIYRSGPEYDYVTIKYSADGSQLWLRRYGANNQADDIARDVMADEDGNVYVVGEGRGLPGTLDETRNGCIIVKYSPIGELLWARGTVKESDRLQSVTATAFWTDGSVAVAGPLVNDYPSYYYRVVSRDGYGGMKKAFDIRADFHPLYHAPCALAVTPFDVTHDRIIMVGSRATQSKPSLEFVVAALSSYKGVCWIDGFSAANEWNAASAAVLCPDGRIVVAGLCKDNLGNGGIVLVRYSE